MDIVNAVRDLYYATMSLPEPYSKLTDEQKRYANELLSRFEALAAEFGTVPYGELLLPMLLSKNGRHKDALEVTEQQYLKTPDWNTAVAVANAARRSGAIERAVEMFAKAGQHDPSDVTCWLEIGDTRLEQGRFADALEAYETALGKEPANQWALPSSFYCRHRLGVEGNWLASIREVAKQEGCTCGMEGCLTALFGGYGSERGIARAEYLLNKLANEVG